MKIWYYSTALLLLLSCGKEKKDFDAAGNFEADEVIVSAEQSGRLLQLAIREGDTLSLNQVVGQLDVAAQQLQEEQTRATIASLQQKTVTPAAEIDVAQQQLAVQEAQLQTLYTERNRFRNLVNAGAAPGKQLDDINAQITQLREQMAVTKQQIRLYRSNAATKNRSILSEKAPLEKAAEQAQLQIRKGSIINPITGIVLTKYAQQGELATAGRPLYKIANTDTLTLKAYITGEQLPLLKTGQPVTVRIDNGGRSYKTYPGRVSWISARAEFTPKTIQTKNERANLVYAIKVLVKNDGYLKIGMYGEVLFNRAG